MLNDEEIKIQCRQAANMVVDGLIMAGLLRTEDGDRAVGIAEEELIVRKAMGKL